LLGSEGRLGGTLRVEDRAYRIVGILQERQRIRGKIPALPVRNYNRAVFIPLGTEPPVFHSREELGELSEISVQVIQDGNVQATASVAKRILTRNHGGVEDFQIVIPQELLEQAQRTQRVFNIVLGCIAGISLLVGGIGIMNIMLASVAERTREIGIRRAIGASKRHIILQFLSESILLTLVGGCLGIALGIGGAFAISAFAGWKTLLTVWSIVIAMVMAMGVGLLSGLFPAIRAAQLDPIAALRHE
jgi:putative ABC transport system permease protein